jgi:hypothetical protein
MLALLAIATIWWPGSYLGNLQHRDVTFVEFEGNIVGATMVARQPKEIQPKASKIGITMNENLCLVQNLHAFIQRTSHIRHDLDDDHTLFLAHMTHDKHRARSIRPKTVSVWLEEIMKMARIDTHDSRHILSVPHQVQKRLWLVFLLKTASYMLTGV